MLRIEHIKRNILEKGTQRDHEEREQRHVSNEQQITIQYLGTNKIFVSSFYFSNFDLLGCLPH